MRSLILNLFILVSLIAFAQNELYVGYGVAPVGHKFMPSCSFFDNGLAGYEPGLTIQSRLGDADMWGSLNVIYLRGISDKLSCGLSYSYFSHTPDYISGYPYVYGLPRTHSHIVMAVAKWKWVSYKKFVFYSRCGLGARFNKASFPDDIESHFQPIPDDPYTFTDFKVLKDKSTDFAWQVSAVCCEFKVIDRFSLFAEGGIGTQGCFIAGIKTAF